MPFAKYNVADNAYSTLLVGISAGSLSLQVQASAGDRFPATNFIATLVQYATLGDDTSAVVKREKVLVSNNATDTFTISRGFDGDTPVSFNAGDFVYLNSVSAITEDIQSELTRLESAKLGTGALRSALAGLWSFFFTNGSGNETAVGLGALGTVLTSNGATVAPTFQTPTVGITGLTEDTVGDMAFDYLVKNNGTGANTKILVKTYKASSAEALAGTSDAKFMTPSTTKDSIEDSIGTPSAGFWFGTNYQATVAGFVSAYGNSNGNTLVISGYVGASNPASTLIAQSGSDQQETHASLCFPVKKGYYWRVDGNPITSSGIIFTPHA